jgi:NUMOD4 motif
MFYGYEDEEWADIQGYPDYSISNFGRVWSWRTNCFLKPSLDVDGYERVDLYWNGKATHMKVHRLVSMSFLPNRMTRSEQSFHAFRTGLNTCINKRAIRILETGEKFDSLTECAHSINGSIGDIHQCLSGKRKHHRGYTFEYIDEGR